MGLTWKNIGVFGFSVKWERSQGNILDVFVDSLSGLLFDAVRNIPIFVLDFFVEFFFHIKIK